MKGPYPQSQEKKRYVIVLVDLFTLYAWTRCAKHVDGKAVADFLIEDVFSFGVFNTIITDNAPNLKEGIAGYLYPRLGTENRNSTAFWPSGNGAVERLIGTLATMIRCTTEDDPAGWSSCVSQLTAKYNHSPHRGTGYSPFILHFGYEPREVSLIEIPEEPGNFGTQERYLAELKQTRARVEAAARKGLVEYYETMAKDHDTDPRRKVKKHKFFVGQWVLVKILHVRAGETKSLGAHYMGPAEILKIDEHKAEVRYINNGLVRTRNVAHLKEYFRREGRDEPTEKYTGPLRRRHGDPEDSTGESRIERGLMPASPILDLVSQGDEGSNSVEEDDEDPAPVRQSWTAGPDLTEDDSEDEDDKPQKHVTFASLVSLRNDLPRK